MIKLILIAIMLMVVDSTLIDKTRIKIKKLSSPKGCESLINGYVVNAGCLKKNLQYIKNSTKQGRCKIEKIIGFNENGDDDVGQPDVGVNFHFKRGDFWYGGCASMDGKFFTLYPIVYDYTKKAKLKVSYLNEFLETKGLGENCQELLEKLPVDGVTNFYFLYLADRVNGHDLMKNLMKPVFKILKLADPGNLDFHLYPHFIDKLSREQFGTLKDVAMLYKNIAMYKSSRSSAYNSFVSRQITKAAGLTLSTLVGWAIDLSEEDMFKALFYEMIISSKSPQSLADKMSACANEGVIFDIGLAENLGSCLPTTTWFQFFKDQLTDAKEKNKFLMNLLSTLAQMSEI